MLTEALFQATGKCSWFGGPNDLTGVSASEGLAFHYDVTAENQHLFLPYQPAGSTGLARRLNPWVHYIACRWDYSKYTEGDARGLRRCCAGARNKDGKRNDRIPRRLGTEREDRPGGGSLREPDGRSGDYD